VVVALALTLRDATLVRGEEKKVLTGADMKFHHHGRIAMRHSQPCLFSVEEKDYAEC
jgi:hypothetical protein